VKCYDALFLARNDKAYFALENEYHDAISHKKEEFEVRGVKDKEGKHIKWQTKTVGIILEDVDIMRRRLKHKLYGG